MPQLKSPGPLEIEPLGLLLAAGLIGVVVLISAVTRLGLVRDLLVASARCYAQLILLGLILVFLLTRDQPWMTGLMFGLMIFFSAYTITRRLRAVPVPIFKPVLLAVSSTGIGITLLVTWLILGVEPFWKAQYWIPIGGMVLGNSMNGIALAIERAFADLDLRRNEVQATLSLGGERDEVLQPSVRLALKAGLIPTMNNLSVAGLVHIPGMMTGQVLAGAEPGQAARYQIVVLLMIAAATAIGSILAVRASTRLAFDREGVLSI